MKAYFFHSIRAGRDREWNGRDGMERENRGNLAHKNINKNDVEEIGETKGLNLDFEYSFQSCE